MGIRISGGRVRGVCEYCGECVYEADLSEDEIDIATDRLNAHECAEQDPDWLANDDPDPDPYSDSKTGVELVRVVRDSGIVKNEAEVILAQFRGAVEIIGEWEKRAADIEVTDETQTAEMALAKSARKEVAKARTGAKKLHDELKADSLRRGQFIDGIFRVIAAHAKPVEEYLEKQEK
ncbi:MAG: hypothetical protein RBT43_07300, partial [bacterium]|nr:hypothetical protein [bacterium]